MALEDAFERVFVAHELWDHIDARLVLMQELVDFHSRLVSQGETTSAMACAVEILKNSYHLTLCYKALDREEYAFRWDWQKHYRDKEGR